MLICPNCKNFLSLPNFNKDVLSCTCGVSFPLLNGIRQFALDSQISQYSQEQIKRLEIMEKKHFWFKARRVLIISLLKRYLKPGSLVLDAGCGTGENIAAICKAGFKGVGIDLQLSGLEHKKKEIPQLNLLQADIQALPFKDGVFQAVVLADILEHIEEKVLNEINRVLSPNGLVLIMVPAYQSLWSLRDKAAGHLRRYNKKRLKKLALEYFGKIEFLSGYQFSLFPLFFLLRKLNFPPLKEEKIIPGLNFMLYYLNFLEVKSQISWPWGTSLVGLIRKNAK